MIVQESKRINYSKTEIQLPWNNAAVCSTGNIKDKIENYIPEDIRYFLPSSIIILYDKEVSEETIDDFIVNILEYLVVEFKHREKRKQRFISLGLLTNDEFTEIINQNKELQPWLLYYSKNGGLGTHDNNSNSISNGMIPCASMRNHGVTWQTNENKFNMWLVTSRKENDEWDWDSDLGHESGHACFAPIPLFVQSLHLQQGESAQLINVGSINELTSEHIARICYIITEITVIAVRGERRETISGLPVAENPEEFRAFLHFSELLMPGMGFKNALIKYNELKSSFIDVNNDNIIFYVGAACLRGLSQIKKSFTSLKIPSLSMFSC